MSEMMQMPDGWELKPFSSLATINMGQSPDSEFVNENQEGMAFLQGNAEFGDVNPKELYWVTVPKKIAKKDDILISVRAPVGDMNIADKEYCIGRGLSALTVKKINQKFGFYALFQERVQLDRLAQGSTFLAIGKNDFDKLLIKYPKEKKEQDKIAKILSTLDKAIESTNRLIDKEKNIKTALMQELLTNGIDQNGQIRTKATHTYKPSELGLIPDEWEVVSLEKICIKSGIRRGPFGGALKKEIFVEQGFKVYEQQNAIYKNLSLGHYYIDKAKFDEMKAFEVKPDDFLISCSGTIGKIVKIPKNIEKGIINQALLKLTLNEKIIDSLFFISQFESDLIQFNIIDNTQGGALKNLVGMNIFKHTLFYLPPKNEQKQIAKILTTQDKKIQTEETNLAKLKELKKGLMNDLLSGKVRVKI